MDDDTAKLEMNWKSPETEMSLHMFKCQVSNVFHQFKWVLCEKCHHSPFLCVVLFQNCASCLFQLGNLLVFSFKFSLVLTAKCTGKDDLMLFSGGGFDAFSGGGLPYGPPLSQQLNPPLFPEVKVLLCTWSHSLQNIAELFKTNVAAVQSRDECFRCFWTSHSTFSWCSV